MHRLLTRTYPNGSPDGSARKHRGAKKQNRRYARQSCTASGRSTPRYCDVSCKKWLPVRRLRRRPAHGYPERTFLICWHPGSLGGNRNIRVPTGCRSCCHQTRWHKKQAVADCSHNHADCICSLYLLWSQTVRNRGCTHK